MRVSNDGATGRGLDNLRDRLGGVGGQLRACIPRGPGAGA
jgi:hypothetical protein